MGYGRGATWEVYLRIEATCKGGLHTFAVYIRHSQGWTARNEALVEAVIMNTRDTPYPWLIACDANMEPEFFFCARKVVR